MKTIQLISIAHWSHDIRRKDIIKPFWLEEVFYMIILYQNTEYPIL